MISKNVFRFFRNSELLMVADQEKDRKKRRRNQGKDEDPEPQSIP